ncbi:MAG TPA: hypothetical protein PKM43_24140 [Verrucomicrobiota bacterium]|nr:hypothetical protein [Verrucomicrobiota bacterium]
MMTTEHEDHAISSGDRQPQSDSPVRTGRCRLNDHPARASGCTRRRRTRSILFVFALTSPLWASGIPVEVATDKTAYYPGEELKILITVPIPMTLQFLTALQTLYTIDSVYTPIVYVSDRPTQATTPKTWTRNHRWADYRLPLGNHTIVGIVVDHGESVPVSFGVVQPPKPEGAFVLDFDTIPGTTARVAHLMAYESIGVRFHTAEGQPCTLRNLDGDSWIQGFDPYPSGFNVAASFDVPVFGVSAQVAGALGVQITMVGKDAAGETLASTTSPAIAQPVKFGQTLNLTTTRPIVEVEWRPSAPKSVCAVDNVAVVTFPPPSVNCIVIQKKLMITWTTVAGFNYQLWSSPDLRVWSPCGVLQTGTGAVLTHSGMDAGAIACSSV